MTSRLLIAGSILLAIATSAHAQQFEKKMYNYSKFATGIFAEAATVTGPSKTIYLAGIGAEEPDDGSIRHKGSFLDQCRFTWQKIKQALAANGATVADIVKNTTYLTDIRNRVDLRECNKDAFGDLPPPPSTLLNIVQLARPGMMIEVDVVAVVAAK